MILIVRISYVMTRSGRDAELKYQNKDNTMDLPEFVSKPNTYHVFL